MKILKTNEVTAMAKKEEGKLLDHNYDGIQELDNKLPPWWLNLFYLTIVFAVVYFLYYQVLGIGDSQLTEYHKEMDPNWKGDKNQSSLLGGYNSPWEAGKNSVQKAPEEKTEVAAGEVKTEEKEKAAEVLANYTQLTDAASLELGKQVFKTNCVACHGAQAQGIIGPNLTDDYWIDGDGSFNAVVHTIQVGVPAKGMISWKPLLKEKDLLAAASYVMSIRGSNPANPKAPQGKKYGAK